MSPKRSDRASPRSPGKLCKILYIDRTLNALPLGVGEPLRLEHRSAQFQNAIESGAISIVQTSRIGISQGIDLPWRWYIGNCAAVSKF
ncbi:MAG: DNA-3-methyladenine glycosylase [Microcoleus sp.]